MRKKNQEYFNLLPKEELVMKVLWDTEEALSGSEIAERIPNRDWPAASIQNILRSLEKKNAIRVDAITKLGKSYGRLFRPTISADEYAASQFERYYNNGKKAFSSLVLTLIDKTSVGKEEIVQTLQDIMETYDKRE